MLLRLVCQDRALCSLYHQILPGSVVSSIAPATIQVSTPCFENSCPVLNTNMLIQHVRLSIRSFPYSCQTQLKHAESTLGSKDRTPSLEIPKETNGLYTNYIAFLDSKSELIFEDVPGTSKWWKLPQLSAFLEVKRA